MVGLFRFRSDDDLRFESVLWIQSWWWYLVFLVSSYVGEFLGGFGFVLGLWCWCLVDWLTG